MVGSSRHFIPKGFEILSVDDPIHIPLVLDEFITSPDKLLNTSRRLQRACAESMSDRTAVVSSAYWRSFVSSPPILIPIIYGFWRIAKARVSTATTNKYEKAVLIMKDNSMGNTHDNYQPITCLALMWKLLTGKSASNYMNI